jgi:hypothetical protein
MSHQAIDMMAIPNDVKTMSRDVAKDFRSEFTTTNPLPVNSENASASDIAKAIRSEFTSGNNKALVDIGNSTSNPLYISPASATPQPVDTEFATAIAVADNLTLPFSPVAIAATYGYNGSNWDKMKTAGIAGVGVGRRIVAPGTPVLNLLTLASGIGAGSTINLYSTYSNITSQLIIVSGTLSAISYNVEGSMNGSIWYLLGNSTDITNGAALFIINKGFLQVRANLLTLAGTGTPTVSIVAGATP